MFKSKKPQQQQQQQQQDFGGSSDASVVRVKPFHYLHVLDNNTGTTRVVRGPTTFTRQDHEKIVEGPSQMIIIPPRNYCIISNPVVRGADGQPELDEHGNYRVRHGDEEIRMSCDPFPLYPNEKLYGKVNPLQVVAPDSALRLRCIRDFTDGAIERKAGDEWLVEGPRTYIPRIEVQVVEIIRAIIVDSTQGLRLRARQECKDSTGRLRQAGEEWLHRGNGAYLPGVDEEVVQVVEAITLTDKKALHLRADRTYEDQLGNKRKAGEEWLVTSGDSEIYLPDVNETIIGHTPITSLNARQYAVIIDPTGPDGKPQFGKKELRKGDLSFFLLPGERLENGIQSINVLGESEALLLRAREEYVENDTKHAPGDRWMIYGPCEYIPPVEVEIIEKRSSMPLGIGEGVYVRDLSTGRVRSVVGQSYMLLPNEELWEKDLPAVVEQLIQKEAGHARDKTRVVTLSVRHNSCVQIYDYKEKRSRVCFGPELVQLSPDEQFTVLSLSGGKPKKPHQIKSLALRLGPDYFTDHVIVETADHARLLLVLSYNWSFNVAEARQDLQLAEKLFSVPDFIGDACKAIAARVRGAVASTSFDEFHKSAAKVIRGAVFGIDSDGHIGDAFHFPANLLTVTNIDIQAVNPVDQRTRDSLQKSVQLAIEITTRSQEATARQVAEQVEQEARGRLERQKINDEAEAEKARKELLQLQAASAAVESTGQATAEAKARADAAEIEGASAVELARLKAESSRIQSSAELESLKTRQLNEVEYRSQIDTIEVEHASGLAQIESDKFKKFVAAIGSETIAAIAAAGPEAEAKLLGGLGLNSVLITDGSSPINLFNTAKGLVGAPQGE